MKKLLLIGLIALISATAFAGGGKDKTDQLDKVIRETSDYLNANLTNGVKLAFINIQSDYPAFSEYIIDELISNTVNDRNFTVVDRQQLDSIRAELNFQMSGEVDDNTAQQLGRMTGAQIIINGNLTKIGNTYRLRVRALSVQTAQIEGQINKDIQNTEKVANLIQATSTARPATAQANSTQTGVQAIPVQQSAQTYRVGDTGPAGGLIFYDKGNNNGGWRYLEAAPVEAEFQALWSIRRTLMDNILPERIGSGQRNTQLIVEKLATVSGEWDTAAQKCNELVFGGFDDWFLPSRAELDQMYGQLKRRNLGDFKNEFYWSSTTTGNWINSCVRQNFADGRIVTDGWPDSRFNVRPIRQVAGQ